MQEKFLLNLCFTSVKFCNQNVIPWYEYSSKCLSLLLFGPYPFYLSFIGSVHIHDDTTTMQWQKRNDAQAQSTNPWCSVLFRRQYTTCRCSCRIYTPLCSFMYLDYWTPLKDTQKRSRNCLKSVLFKGIVVCGVFTCTVPGGNVTCGNLWQASSFGCVSGCFPDFADWYNSFRCWYVWLFGFGVTHFVSPDLVHWWSFLWCLKIHRA